MSVSAIIYLLLIGVLVPTMALLGKRALDRGKVIPRMPFYIESSVLQLFLFAIAALVSHRNGFDLTPPLDVSPRISSWAWRCWSWRSSACG